MDKLLSIIVPVYNAEKFLHKCVDSIISAADETCEIILVNDGSKDNSGAICDEYGKKDARVTVIHQKNMGVIAARKNGVKMSGGEYITFVDSDDWIDEQMYSTMLGVIEETGAEVVICDICRETNRGTSLMENHVEAGFYEKEKLKKEFYSSMLFNFQDGCPGINPSLCNKIMKKKIIEDVILDIDDTITYGEDALCTYPAMLNAEKIFVISNVGFYHYRENLSSVTNIYDKLLLEKCLSLFDELRRQFSIRKFDDNKQIEGYAARISLECIRIEMLYNKKASVRNRIKAVRKYVEDERVWPTFGLALNRVSDRKLKTKMRLVKNKRFFILYMMFYVKQIILNIKRKKYEN